MTIEGLMGSLCAREYRMNQRSAEPVEQAFQSKVTLSNTSSSSGGKELAQGKASKSMSPQKGTSSQQSNSNKKSGDGRYDKSKI